MIRSMRTVPVSRAERLCREGDWDAVLAHLEHPDDDDDDEEEDASATVKKAT